MVFQLMKKKSSGLVGLDFNAATVKQIEIDRQGDSFKIKNLAVIDTPSNSINDNEIKDIDAVSQAISRARQAANTATTNVAIVVPGANVVIKEIKMNAGLSEMDMEAQAWIEASQHFPDLIDDISLDFSILGICENDASRVDVLLVACRKENVQSRLNTLHTSGYEADIVDVDFYAMERAFPLIAKQVEKTAQNNPIALFNIGPKSTTLVVISQQKMVYSRVKDFDLLELMVGIDKIIDHETWQQRLRDANITLNEEQQTAINRLIIQSMVPHLRHLMQFFYSAAQNEKIGQVVLAGEGALISGIDNIIEQNLSIPTCVANPFHDVSVMNNVDQQLLENIAPAMLISCGLALRGTQA